MSVRKQVGLHGRRAYITKDDQVGARNGFVAGGVDKPAIVSPSPDTVAIFEDFIGDLSGTSALDTGTAGQYFLSVPGDTGVKGALTAGTNGVYRITPSITITTATPAGSNRGIVGKQLAWKVNQGPGGQSGRLRMGARVKMADTGGTKNGMAGVFVGFTDVATNEVPIHDTGRTGDSGASAVTTAADAVGFLWGTNGDTGWRGVSAKSTAGDSGDQQVTLTTTAPVANKWVALEVEIHRGFSDTGGTATFYIDGIAQGAAIDSPVATSTALTPCIYYYDTGGQANFDVDWINVSAPRDTGL